MAGETVIGSSGADLLEGERYLLMLARDAAPPDPANWYVPYFSAVYPLTADGRVRLPTEILDERTQEIAGISGAGDPCRCFAQGG